MGVGYALVREGTQYNLDTSYAQYYWVTGVLDSEEGVNADNVYLNHTTKMTATPNSGEAVYSQYITIVGGLTKLGQATTTRTDATLEAVKTALTSMGVTVIANSDSSKLFAFSEDTIEKAESAPADATGFAIVVNGENKFVPYGTSIQKIAALCGDKGEITFPQSLMMTAKPGANGAPEAVAPSGGTGDGGNGGGTGGGTGGGGNGGNAGDGSGDGGNGGTGGTDENAEENKDQTNDNQTEET